VGDSTHGRLQVAGYQLPVPSYAEMPCAGFLTGNRQPVTGNR
jgi:hypothetical protein